MSNGRQKRAPGKKPAPKLSQEEIRAQVVGWTVYKMTHSPESVRGDIREIMLEKVPRRNHERRLREMFPGFLEIIAGERGGEQLLKRKKATEFKKFLENPGGKEFALFVTSEGDAKALYRFMKKCGLLRNVDGEVTLHSEEAGDSEFPHKITITAKKKWVGKIGPRMKKAYALSKGKLTAKDQRFLKVIAGALKSKDPLAGSSEILDLSPEHKKAAPKKKGTGLVVAMPLRAPSAKSGRQMKIFSSRAERDEFMQHYKSGEEYSFRIGGTESFPPAFRKMMKEKGLNPSLVTITKVSRNLWEVNVGENVDYKKMMHDKLEAMKGG